MAMSVFKVTDFNKAYDDFDMARAVRLGKGGFGKVYLVRHKKSKVWWAAKYQNSTSRRMIEMHREEARFQSELQDEHKKYVPEVYKYYEKGYHTLLINEYIRGGEIFEKINDRNFTLTEDKIIRYSIQLVKALNFIHSRDILHMDMKPQNVMLVDDKRDSIKIIDFGLAKRLKQMRDSRGNLIKGTKTGFSGTIGFMAPEVLNCTEATPSTDFFSLGVVIFMLVTGGHEPFWERDDTTALKNTLKADPWRKFKKRPLPVSREAVDFVGKLLHKDRDSRLYGARCLQHPWLTTDMPDACRNEVDKSGIRSYLVRQRWKKLYKGVVFALKMQRMVNNHANSGGFTDSGYGGGGGDQVDSGRSRVYDTMKTVHIPIRILDK